MKLISRCKRSIFVFCGIVFIGFCSHAADYSDNLNDIQARDEVWGHVSAGCHKPTPIGNLGGIETVIDLRGFVPMSFASENANSLGASFKRTISDPRTLLENVDTLRWYKIPTRKALLMLYFGDLKSTELGQDASKFENRFENTQFLKESEAKGEMIAWCKLAYAAAKDSEPIFKTLAGKDGFEGAEAVTLLFTEQSCFVFLNLKYSNSIRKGTGQLLVAMEFSRYLKEYKTFYLTYTTMVVSKSTREGFAETAPYIIKALRAVFGAQ